MIYGIRTEEEIKIMREGGKILSSVMKTLGSRVKSGISTGELEDLACELIEKAGGRPSFKNYKISPDSAPFPTALCTSINEEVVHGPAYPSRVVSEGDIISIDVGMEYPYSENGQGMYTDMARTFPVGKIDKKIEDLIDATRKCLDLGIKQIKPGNTINDIGSTIENYIESKGFSVVRDLVGHGVGRAVHEEPQIPHYYAGKHYDIKLKEGMTIAVEPMVNMGSWEIDVLDDEFTFVSRDGSTSAHFEDTILITKKGAEIITR
ncbi:MAG: type I methionyl aminopeptidase [Patescibacteria group bacterium]|jgi:methionyl aminopeptidase|nr:type I methionyl aminopeptidase [Patescibacteria group bacterium]